MQAETSFLGGIQIHSYLIQQIISKQECETSI
jgi:hypothetical protein